jgi:hypothetical protein
MYVLWVYQDGSDPFAVWYTVSLAVRDVVPSGAVPYRVDHA